ncbi:glycosyltransferase family 2 protein [Lysinibacillus irui]|uniref:Glycosyltransferase n=1 Tax=Lysinibacillus irui TaxID=2998077 RepID=A0AAJ5UTY9_9BACI|nr:glycosyltransferase [Lysinibacillus irui]WDV07468.1 glycosyltransferase [Lysinibacillus irui]
MKKVSIIIPTYNRAKLLKKSIESCLQQTYKNIELIIVDDGSTDNTCEILHDIKDGRVKYIFQENKGLPEALNTGFKNAEGDYLTWTSDDNLYRLETIKVMVDRLEELGEPGFVYTDMEIYYEDTGETEYRNYSVNNRIYMGNYIGACFLYSKEIYNEIGDYDPDMYLAEDYDYWIRVCEKYPMIHIPKNLYIYRDHKESLSRSRRLKVIEAFEKVFEKNDCYTKMFSEIANYSLERDIYIYGKGAFAERIYKNSSFPNFKGFIDSFIKEEEVFCSEKVYPLHKLTECSSKPYIIIASTFRAEIEKNLKKIDYKPILDFY